MSFGGVGGNATATSTATSVVVAQLSATATATGGGTGSANSGQASALSTAQNASGTVKTAAQSPSGVAARAETMANIGSGTPSLIDIKAGQATSLATLTPGALGFGVMSAGYGGAGEPSTYQASADFSFTPAASEELYLILVSDAFSGVGFDKLELKIDAGGTLSDYVFTSLGEAGMFFTDNKLDLGALAGGSPFDVDLSYSLTASEPGAGFGFAYDSAVPEPSTWALMLLGFVGLGVAGYRRARKFSVGAVFGLISAT